MFYNQKALVLLSGGQDSATCLLWALENFDSVETIGFDYGQRHKIELEIRQEFLNRLPNIKTFYKDKLKQDKIFKTDIFQQIGETSLTADTEIIIMDNGLPSTFVPARNLLFFTIAGGYGWRRGIKHFVGGMCETDFSGYPDCRDNTLKALQIALSGGLDMNCVIHTPLMWLNKAQTWHMIYNIGGQKAVDLCVDYTHSCYKGIRETKYLWGYGCNDCPACYLRQNGYNEYQQNNNQLNI